MKTIVGKLLESIRASLKTIFTPRTTSVSKEGLEARLLLFVQD